VNRNDFNLPPTVIAKPLAATKPKKADSKKPKQPKKTKSENGSTGGTYSDDTPRDFARLMRRIAPPKPEEPPGKPQGRKRKRGESSGEGGNNKDKIAKSQGPKILPGERMSDFAARVDQALPLSGISRKAGNSLSKSSDAAIRKLRETRQTKHEKKLRRLQDGWRKDEERIREKEAEAREELEERQEEINELLKGWKEEAGGGIGKKKKKGSGMKKKKKTKRNNKAPAAGEDASGTDDDESESDDDPWAKLNKKATAKPANPFEVVQAPPTNLVKPKEKFKVHGMGGAKVDVANVPAAAGSLRARGRVSWSNTGR
jgi:hypothetical protein